MIITKNNIKFYHLKEEDIELVRHWRNHPSIQKHMVYREHITAEMQKEWFKSISNNNNMYLIIEYKGKKIGLINGKDFNWERRSMETGIFIWDKYYRKTHIPTLCTMMFAELGVTIWKTIPTATVLKSNEKALRYNKMLGFKIIEDEPDKEYVKMELDTDSMSVIAKKLKVALNMLSGDDPIKIVFEKQDIEGGLHDLLSARLPENAYKKKEIGSDTITYYF